MLREDFAALVREDASSVEKRQETDSIPIIDDIRFFINEHVQTFSDMAEAERDMKLIEEFLVEMDLDA